MPADWEKAAISARSSENIKTVLQSNTEKNGRIVISYVRNKIAMRKLGKMFLLMFRFIAIMEKHFYVSVKNVIKEVKKEAGLDVNTDLVIAV